MNAPINPPELDLALKSLWGARELPFGAAVETPYADDTFKQTRHRLEQLVSVRACGLLHGPNGVGKTLLVQHFLKSLPDKRYKPLVLSHSSVTGSDLLRLLCLELGQPARMRRSDNVMLIRVFELASPAAPVPGQSQMLTQLPATTLRMGGQSLANLGHVGVLDQAPLNDAGLGHGAAEWQGGTTECRQIAGFLTSPYCAIKTPYPPLSA